MTRIRIIAGLGIVAFLAFSNVSIGRDNASQATRLAQTSCQAMQSLCARRCKQRVPDDANCVSDHCTPKLVECKQTSCWQEGNLYGGKQTCALKKT